MIEVTHFASNRQELRPGTAVRVAVSRGAIEFSLYAVCDVVPDQWHGEVRFGSEVLLASEAVSTESEASRRAEQLIRQRIVEIFRRTDR